MHEFRGGIRIGNSYFDAVNYSYPFARVCFAEKSLHFSIGIFSFRKNFSIPYCDMTRISIRRRIIGYGILIEHRSNSLPKFIVFWTVQGRSFFRTCEEYSIPILKANYSNNVS